MKKRTADILLGMTGMIFFCSSKKDRGSNQNGSLNTARLKDVAFIKSNFPDADFWIQTRGSSADSIGTVHRQFGTNIHGQPAQYGTVKDIGIKVKPEFLNRIDPRYLSYMLEYLHMQGIWKRLGHSGTIMWNIPIREVKNLSLQLDQNE